jgi:hypothetical protein
MNKLVNEELNKMKYLLGYQKGKVISEQAQPSTTPAAAPAAAPAATTEDVIKQIQTVLKTKYKANLGNSGPNKDGVDGKWGNLTQTAFEAAVKSKPTGTATPAAAPSVMAPTIPGVSYQTQPDAQSPDEIVGTEVAPQSNRDQRRDRQDMRRDQRRARQDLRAQQRAQ